MNDSPTPRTDAMTKHHNDGVPSDFARELEIELNAANALNQELVLKLGILKERQVIAFNKKVSQ